MAAAKKKNRWIGPVIAVLVLILLGGAYFALTKGGDGEDAAEPAADTGAPALERIPATVIRHLVLSRDGQDYTLDLLDEKWVLASEPDRPLDPSRMAKLTYALSTFGVKRLIEKNPADLSLYGLDHPSVTVEASSPTDTEKISLGAENAATGVRYILWTDGAVYTADAESLSGLDVTLSDLTYMEPLPEIDLADVRRVTVLKGDGTAGLTLEHLERPKSDDFTQSYLWYVQEGDGPQYPADTSLTETAVKKILSLQLEECISYRRTEEEQEQYGLDVPQLAAVVETGRGPVLTLLFGKETDGKLALLFNDCSSIYAVKENGLLKDLTQDASALRPLEWVRISAQDLTGLNLVFSGTAMEMNRTEDQWYLNGSEMDAGDWNTLYAALQSLRPQGWAEREVGEDAPSALTVRMSREGVTQLVRFREYDVGFYAAEIDGRAEMLFSRRDVDAFRATAGEVYRSAVEKSESADSSEE